MAAPYPMFTSDQLDKKVKAYFKEIKEKKQPPTVSGLAYYLGFVSRQSIYDYANREKEATSSYVIKRAVLFIEVHYETMLNKPSGNIAGIIFWLKNHGWRDVIENGTDVLLDELKQMKTDLLGDK